MNLHEKFICNRYSAVDDYSLTSDRWIVAKQVVSRVGLDVGYNTFPVVGEQCIVQPTLYYSVLYPCRVSIGYRKGGPVISTVVS